ncbi:hypothetical protein ACFL6P_07740 [Candidatus Latescibacterota bacterium]
MNDRNKTKSQLIDELNELRKAVSETKNVVSASGEQQNNLPEQESEYKSTRLSH